MSLTNPSVSNVQLLGTIKPQILSPLSDTIPVALPIGFTNVANLQSITGSFTPANNTHTIVQGLSSISPNFFFFFCDGLCVLNTDNSFVAGMPVMKFAMGTMTAIAGGTNPIAQFYLDGHSNLAYPMAQGVAVNYTLIIGQADIT